MDDYFSDEWINALHQLIAAAKRERREQRLREAELEIAYLRPARSPGG